MQLRNETKTEQNSGDSKSSSGTETKFQGNYSKPLNAWLSYLNNSNIDFTKGEKYVILFFVYFILKNGIKYFPLLTYALAYCIDKRSHAKRERMV